MSESEYIHRIRKKVGNDLIILPAVVGMIYNDLGQILLGKNKDMLYWLFPGGNIEPYESPADALVREVWEETGLVVEPLRITGVYGGKKYFVIYKNKDKVSYVLIVFECKVKGGDLRPDGEELSELKFYSFSDITQLKLAKWIYQVIDVGSNKANEINFQAPTWKPNNY